MGKLTAMQVKNLTEPGRYSDGDGLILDIGKSGRTSWILRDVLRSKTAQV
ncbi:integrase arm-type DNA-binding domain-containing protein [Sphingobium sp. CR28]